MTNVINNSSLKFDKEDLTELFSDFELAFNPSLSQETEPLITQYENETKAVNKHTINIKYSPGTYVSRVKENGNKSFYPKHYQDEKWVNGVGDTSNWLPYRYPDLQYCQGKFALMNEGEKATDYARYIGLISFCLLGAKSQNEEFIKNNLLYIQSFGLLGLVCVADDDSAGLKKAKLIQSVGKKIDFPVLILPIKLIYPNAKKGDDIVEYLQANSQESPKLIKADIEITIDSHLNLLIDDYFTEEKEPEPSQFKILTIAEAVNQARTLLQNIEDEIELNIALEELRTRTKISSYAWKNDFIKPLKKEIKKERLVLEIQAFLQEPDPVNRIYLKQSICGNYSVNNKDFEFLVNHTEQKNQTPEQIVFDGDEFFDLPDEEEEWLIPSLLPKGEMMLLTALPKVGKSLLASDIVYAVLTGEKVLGEEAVKSKVLYVGSDESRSSLKRRMRARGIDLIPNKKEKLKIVTYLDLTDTARLEKELEDFRPDLVIIDSLTSTTLNLGVSEKDAEFAKPIYRLKDLLKKYNCASVLIHHENKNKEAKGICKVSGSARITAAVWGIAQMTGSDGQLIEKNQDLVKNANHRILSLSPREGEKVTFNLNINPKDLWGEQGIFEFLGEADDPKGEKKTQGDQVIELLKTKQVPLEYGEVDEYLGIGRSLYTVLDRLVDRKLITKRRSHNNPKRFVYLISNQSQEETIKNVDIKESTPHTPLPSSNSSGDKIENSKPITNKETEVSQQVSQQLVNTTESNKVDVNSLNEDIASDLAKVNNFSENQGGGGNVDSVSTENDVDSNCETDGFVENLEVQNAEYRVQSEENEVNSEENQNSALSQDSALCTPNSALSHPPKLTGLIVYHLDNPEIKGVIQCEPYQTVGISWNVDVEWDEPRPHQLVPNIAKKNEEVTITCLVSEKQEVLNQWITYAQSLLAVKPRLFNFIPSDPQGLMEKATQLNKILQNKLLRMSSYFINHVFEFLAIASEYDWLAEYDSDGFPTEVFQF